MKAGEAFNPRNTFIGLFIPEALAASTLISSTAKLAYGHLVRRAGDNGRCWPSHRDIAKFIGVKERAARRALKELQGGDPPLIRAVFRHEKGRQTTNAYIFIWGPALELVRIGPLVENDHLPPVKNDHLGVVENDHQKVKEGKCNRKSKEEHQDGSLHSRQKRANERSINVAPFLHGSEPSAYTQGKTSREALRDHLHSWGIQDEAPDEKILSAIIEAGMRYGATVDEITFAIDEKHRYANRQRERTRPRGYEWFITVVATEFRTRRDRDLNPCDDVAEQVRRGLRNDPAEDSARMECF